MDHLITFTSLSWAMSCVLTWPVTKLTLPSTCPVSSPQIVQVVSILEVPAQKKNNYIHSQHFLFSVSNIVIWVYRLNALRFLPNKFGSTSFQSKDVSCAQKSEFLLLLSRHSRRVSLSLTCQSTKHHCLNLTSCSNTTDSIKDELSFQVWKSSQSERA